MSDYAVIHSRIEDRVLFATLDTPSLNLVGPDMVPDLIRLLSSRSNDQVVTSALAQRNRSTDPSTPGRPSRRRRHSRRAREFIPFHGHDTVR